MTGMKQHATISHAAKILKAIFKTEKNGTSTSVIRTELPGSSGVDEVWLGTGGGLLGTGN